MTNKEKEIYKKKLLESKEQIVRKMSEFYSESKEMEPEIAQDLVDKAETSYTKEFLLSLSDAERERLELIDEALKRIETSEYGICLRCHQEISRKRLNVVPWTSYCIACQEKIEEESV